jgi:DNA repair protein RecO (recombination protein O)
LTFKTTEGIILRAIPFQEKDSILVLFTQEVGLLKVFYKGSYRNPRPYPPLSQVEVLYWEKRSEICGCREIKLLNSFPLLRTQLSYLEAATDLLQALLSSQLVGKAAPEIYALLSFYLSKIPQTQDPKATALSFRLKLMKYEGLIRFPLICGECLQPLTTEAYTERADWWCERHQPPGSMSWNPQELQQLDRLTSCQTYREIAEECLSPELWSKFIPFFNSCL